MDDDIFSMVFGLVAASAFMWWLSATYPTEIRQALLVVTNLLVGA